MSITSKEHAAEILDQIQKDQWQWLKVKRFRPDAYLTVEERYAALEKHHAEETNRMIEVIQDFCRTIIASVPSRE